MSTFYTEPTTGTRIATDVIGSDRYQIMKLDGGVIGSSQPLTGTTQYGLAVDPTRPSASSHAVVYVSGAIYSIKQAAINATLNGDNTVIAAVTNRHIRILSMVITNNGGNTDIAFKSGAAVTLIQAISLTNRGLLEVNLMPDGWLCETLAGQAFVLNLNSANTVRGSCNYIEIP